MTELNRAFAKGLFVVLVVVAQIGAIVHLLNDGHERPEGVAERWLSAVSDTGRRGIRADATERAEETGPLSLARPLVPRGHDGEHDLFADLEVGRADTNEGVADVPFRVRQYEGDTVEGTVVLRRDAGGWRVEGLDAGRVTGLVPSRGGRPPSSAPFSLWLLAVVIGLGITSFCSLLVIWAGRGASAMAREVPLSAASYQ